MAYRPDPAGVFESDVHRRVLAALPAPDAEALLLKFAVAPILDDENLAEFNVYDEQTLANVEQVVLSLVESGFASIDPETGGVKRNQSGQDQLEAEVAYEVVPALTDEEIAKREADNADKAVADAARAAEQRIEGYEQAQAEIAEAIERDKALVAEASA